MPSQRQGSQRGRRRAGRPAPGPCHWCGRATHPDVRGPARATWDHLVPRAQDPHQGWDPSRMVRACAHCNSTRRATPAAEWAERMQRTHVDNRSQEW